MALLLSVDFVEDVRHLYFVPDESVIPPNLMRALEKMHGVYCNSEEFETSFWKAWDYVNAAICADPKHLDQKNEHNQNRFAHILVQYRIDLPYVQDPDFGAAMNFEVKGEQLIIIQTGCY